MEQSSRTRFVGRLAGYIPGGRGLCIEEELCSSTNTKTKKGRKGYLAPTFSRTEEEKGCIKI